MIPGPRTATPGRLAALLVTLAVLPLVALGWLGFRYIQNEEQIDRDGVQKRVDRAAALISTQIDQTLTSWENAADRSLETGTLTAPVGTAALVLNSTGVVKINGIVLPFHPTMSRPGAFEAAVTPDPAEQAEFLEKNLTRADALYRAAAETGTPSTRARALVGLGRVLRAQHKSSDALDAYRQLAALTTTEVAGIPAPLVAAEQRVKTLEMRGDSAAADQERRAFSVAVLDGRYRLDRATFDHYVRVLNLTPARSPELAIADALADNRELFRRQPQGRTTVRGNEGFVFLIWRVLDDNIAILAGPAATVTKAFAPALEALRVTASIEETGGRSLKELGIPSTLAITPAAESAPAGWLSRRGLFAGGLALLALVLGGAAYVIFRSIARELAVARLQTEFVAAVSHEFRSPLTAISHLSEVLDEGQASGEERGRYYKALTRESHRLRKLVENLLDFGRLESGRHSYVMRPIDAGDLTRAIVEEFQSDADANNHRVQFTSPAERLPILGDAEALTMALRNLLENAVKYSPGGPAVTVSIASLQGQVAIAVTDRGIGIPPAEKDVVFGKFIRGSSARDLNVKGAGVGLAITKRIVDAHNGRISVESEAGAGSEFTIVLPRATGESGSGGTESPA